MKKIIREKLHCMACQHNWWPKDPEKPPICCPVCKRADYLDLKGPRSIVAAKAAMKRLQTAGK